MFSSDKLYFQQFPMYAMTHPLTQNYVSPQGGIFSGSGVEDGFFYPANVGLGDYTISYQYINAKGCLSTATRVVSNKPTFFKYYSALQEVC